MSGKERRLKLLNQCCTPHARERLAERYPDIKVTLEDWQQAIEAIDNGSACLLNKRYAGTIEEVSTWRVKLGEHEVIAVHRWGRIATVTPNPKDGVQKLIEVADEKPFALAMIKALRNG